MATYGDEDDEDEDEDEDGVALLLLELLGDEEDVAAPAVMAVVMALPVSKEDNPNKEAAVDELDDDEGVDDDDELLDDDEDTAPYMPVE